MDHSKIGLTDFVTICALGAVQTVVTDRHDEELSHWLQTATVELIVADQTDARTGAPTPHRRRARSAAVDQTPHGHGGAEPTASRPAS